MHFLWQAGAAAFLVGRTIAGGCPYMGGSPQGTDSFFKQWELDGSEGFMTTDVGGPISDQNSLSAGERGPTLLEDFIFRQKMQRFDHERVPERAVHARGAGAHGVFVSYGDWSNITAASFLSAKDKETPIFIRFSTVGGSRGSSDTVRDVHGFATRFYTDEGNFDIVGNNVPPFFIQDAIQFPDLIHAVKPEPDREIPQAAAAHDTAWDFFSQQPSTLHTLFWAMSPHGVVRSYRHMDGFGVHTFRLVTDDGKTKLVKFHMKTLQGRASFVWEEAQQTTGQTADLHRQDLFEAIDNDFFPEWEFGVQIMDESDQLRFGFDVLDPTKLVPEDIVPVTILGKLTLNRNTRNYFAETEQIMFQPGHIVRGIDFTDDPLLQGRLFSYLDTQLNRNGGPNFEQLPINQPRVPWNNNNRDGAGQMFIPLNNAAYTPNTLNNGNPMQANQSTGRGFFTAPNRRISGKLMRSVSSTFLDFWSQPRLFFNSLLPVEQQFLINAIRFELSNLNSDVIRQNVLIQLNRVSHDIATRVGRALNMSPPEPDDAYYHDNTTTAISVFSEPLLRLDFLIVGILTSTRVDNSFSALKDSLAEDGVQTVVVAEMLGDGVDATYSIADATRFDAIIVASDAKELFSSESESTLFPTGRPKQILVDGFKFGKPVGEFGSDGVIFSELGIETGPGVITSDSVDTSFADALKEGLKTFKFLNRFPLDK